MPGVKEKLATRGLRGYVSETYVKVGGKWCYLYRVIDRDGILVDSMLSEKRDMDWAKHFFKGAKEVVGHKPTRVTTDGHDSYPRAIRRILGRKVEHRTNRYLNKLLKQDHRGIKQRYYPIRGFGSLQARKKLRAASSDATLTSGSGTDYGDAKCKERRASR